MLIDICCLQEIPNKLPFIDNFDYCTDDKFIYAEKCGKFNVCLRNPDHSFLDLTMIEFEELQITYHNIKTCLNFKDSLSKNTTCKKLRTTTIDGYNDDIEFYQFVNDLNEFLGYFTAINKLSMSQYSRIYFYKLVNILCCKNYEKIDGTINLSQITHLVKGDGERKVSLFNSSRAIDEHSLIEFDRNNVNLLFYDGKGTRKIKVQHLKFVAVLNKVKQIDDYLLFTDYPYFFSICVDNAIAENDFEDAKLQSLFTNQTSNSTTSDKNYFFFGIE